MLTTRLGFIEPQLAFPVDQPPEGKRRSRPLVVGRACVKMDFSITFRGNEVAADINDRQARGIVTAHKIQRLPLLVLSI